MPWDNLGEITPSKDEWRFFTGSDFDGRIFRINHSFALGGVPATLLLASYLPIYDAYFDVRKFYPSLITQIFVSVIPEELKENGIVRDIAIRATTRSQINEQDNWRVSVEVWL